MIDELQLYRINIARKRSGLYLLSMGQARRALEGHADIDSSFDITPFLTKYVNELEIRGPLTGQE